MSGPSNNVAAEIIQVLVEMGVEYIFGVPGGPLTGIFEALSKNDKIRLVLAKHESGASFMAAAHARVGGKLGVCVATSGPGATNALTGLASAYCDSLPVLLLTGQVGTGVFGKGAIQDSSVFGVDVVSIFRPVAKLSAMATSATRIPDLLRSAIRTALSGRPGPVHLSIPADMLRAPLTAHRPFSLNKRLVPTGASDEQLEEVVALLETSSHSCILAGHGTAVAGAHDELLRVAELAAARILTTPKGKGIVSETNAHYLGVLGFGGHQGAHAYFEKGMDLLLIVGSSMNEFVTNAWTIPIPPGIPIVQVDIDPRELGRNFQPDLGIVGDARCVLAALAKKLTPRPKLIAAPPDSLRPPARTAVEESTLKPSRLIHELRANMPDDALLFVDNGSCILWATRYFEVRKSKTYFIDLGLAAMGSAVAGIVGGAMAAPLKRCVALVGDSSFAMHGFEVHTAVEEQLPITWVVLNDGGHGMVRHGDTLMHGAPLGVSDFRATIDVAKAATAMGAHGERVDSLQQFRATMAAALQRRGPSVIDARIDPSEIPPALIKRVETLASMLQAGQAARNPIGG